MEELTEYKPLFLDLREEGPLSLQKRIRIALGLPALQILFPRDFVQ